jgi:DNA sulfur modification protein DndD
MVIEEIVLHNVGVFRGQQKATLAPPRSDKPVVLFGGLNGAGKTTLLEAMQLVLFGRASSGGRRTEVGYEEYLRRLIHRKANPRDGAAVHVTLKVNEGGQVRRLSVRRTWAATGTRVSEKLEVFRGEELDQHLSDNWPEYVGRLIPPQLSELFFFDGERIESLADPAQSLDILRSAIHALLGVDLVRQLQGDLLVLNRRKLIERRPGPEKSKVEDLEITVRQIQEKLRDQRQTEAQLRRDLDRAEEAFQRLDRRFVEEGGELAENRQAVEAHAKELKAQSAQLQAELRAAAAGELPLALVQPLLQQMQAQASAETVANRSTAMKQFVEERDARLLRELESDLGGKLLKRVAAMLAKDRESCLTGTTTEVYLRLDDAGKSQLDLLCTRQLSEATRQATALLSALDEVTHAQDAAERKLASIPDAEAIARLVTDREDARRHRDTLAGQVRHAEEATRAFTLELQAAEANLGQLNDQLREAELGNEETDRFVKHADRARQTLERFRVALTSRHADRLGQTIRDGFQRLLRKQRLVQGLRIEPETCRLALLDAEANELPAERLSAGERQLLAVAILWGLAQASGRSLPVVIDTPLGRLDASHRMHLVERYFPLASHQVILLSTDEEITDRYLEALKPKIGRCYRLVHDDAEGCSAIEPGYFGQEALC